MSRQNFHTEISEHIWNSKYRFRDGMVVHDRTIEDTWHRVARALASAEPSDQAVWEQRFYSIMEGFRFLPGGRILAGAGTSRRVTLFNCFVMGEIDDSLHGIFDALKEAALTMQQGGGVGYDFSTLRPKGAPALSVGAIASGPVSFMRIWDSMCATILSTGARRGAMMATLRCDHPDIEDFIDAKRDRTQLRHFNLSVLVSDAFMQAVRQDDDWLLLFPLKQGGKLKGDIVQRVWSGSSEPVPCKVERRIKARALWDKIMHDTYDYAEPGVIFIDRVNRMNNMWYDELISATNPCGEIPLPSYGVCDLGSINLAAFVTDPFTPDAALNWEAIRSTVTIATRMLDNVYDVSHFPLPQQAEVAKRTRRLGLGLTGLADAFIMLGVRYGGEQSLQLAAEIMRQICHGAYRASIALAQEKGVFPQFDQDKFLRGEFIKKLPQDILSDIGAFGMRNSHLTAIAPAGTISLLANSVSSGLEPVYDFSYLRRVQNADDSLSTFQVMDYAYAAYRELYGEAAPLSEAFVRAGDVLPDAHLAIQAALQTYVDNSISKTINVPQEFDFDAFRSIYADAYASGLKGCTTFRPNEVTGQVLVSEAQSPAEDQCCFADRDVIEKRL